MTSQSSAKQQLISEAQRVGIDLTGISPAGRLEKAPSGRRPADILPAAKSVIVLAQRFLNGPMDSRHWTSYTAVHDGNIARLDTAAYYLAKYIEENFHAAAIPVPAMTPYFHWDEQAQYAAGDLSHKHAAVAAGLGVMGKNSLLITPRYGNQINLVSIITDQELEPDPLLTEELCPPGCRLCVDACPAEAIRGDHTVDQQACRSHCWTKLARGFPVLQCWECRSCCPANKLKKSM